MGTDTIESMPILLGREEEGRWWADIESTPGVVAYGPMRDAAIAAVHALALRVAAACIGTGKTSSALYPDIFRFMSRWPRVKRGRFWRLWSGSGGLLSGRTARIDEKGGRTTPSPFMMVMKWGLVEL
jgi:hypothetical protein